MDDRDFYSLALVCAALALVGIMQSRIIKQLYADHVKVAADVAFLMDQPTVSHETEA